MTVRVETVVFVVRDRQPVGRQARMFGGGGEVQRLIISGRPLEQIVAWQRHGGCLDLSHSAKKEQQVLSLLGSGIGKLFNFDSVHLQKNTS